MPNDKAGRVVFVGNIPYGLSEEQVVHLLGQCGQVLNFRLVYDKESGRPKGFGFAEFSDADAASSAVRNLNGYETMGRTLKVDYSNEAGTGESAAPPATNASLNPQHQQQQSLSQQQHFQQFQQQHQQQQHHQQMPPPPQGLGAAPVGVNLPDNVSAPDAISRTLQAIDPDQLLTVVGQMKELIASDPGRVHQLLTEKPQLAYAMFQALLLMGLVDTTALAQVVDSGPPMPPAQFAPQQPTPLPFQNHPSQQNPFAQQMPHPPLPYPPQFPPQHVAPPMATPPVHNPAYPPPPPSMAPQRPPNISDQQWDSISQICRIPQQAIDGIANPEEKKTILTIRQQYMPYFGAIRGY